MILYTVDADDDQGTPDKLDHGLAIERSNPKRTQLYFVILLKNVEKNL